jgi:hypothetical protein
MGFMDKVKNAAQDAATAAKKGTAQAQEKIEQAQTRKKMDEKAKELGYLIYAERSKGTPAGAQADTLVSEISGLEAALEADAAPDAGSAPAAGTTPAAADAPPPPSTSSSEPTSGDFTL